MNYSIEHISGNSYYITLLPENEQEEQMLQNCGADSAIEQHYKKAIKQNFPGNVKVASLTTDDDLPCRATVELYSVSGSI